MSLESIDIRDSKRAGRQIIACFKSALIVLELLTGKAEDNKGQVFNSLFAKVA